MTLALTRHGYLQACLSHSRGLTQKPARWARGGPFPNSCPPGGRGYPGLSSLDWGQRGLWAGEQRVVHLPHWRVLCGEMPVLLNWPFCWVRVAGGLLILLGSLVRLGACSLPDLLAPFPGPSSAPDTPWYSRLSTQLQPHSCLTLVGNGPLHSESCPHCPGFRLVPGNTSAGLSPGLKQHQLRTGSSCLVCSQTPRGTGTRAALAHSSASWNSCSRSVSAKFFSHSCSHRFLLRTPCMLVLVSQSIVHTAAFLIH